MRGPLPPYEGLLSRQGDYSEDPRVDPHALTEKREPEHKGQGRRGSGIGSRDASAVLRLPIPSPYLRHVCALQVRWRRLVIRVGAVRNLIAE